MAAAPAAASVALPVAAGREVQQVGARARVVEWLVLAAAQLGPAAVWRELVEGLQVLAVESQEPAVWPVLEAWRVTTAA
jgi:hypothetical protein